jgi:hypothetical protein
MPTPEDARELKSTLNGLANLALLLSLIVLTVGAFWAVWVADWSIPLKILAVGGVLFAWSGVFVMAKESVPNA